LKEETEGKSKYSPFSFASMASFWQPEYLVESGWIEHIPFAFWLVENALPEILVELGTYTGLSYFTFCQSIKHLKIQSKCFAVDTWLGDEQTGFYKPEVYDEVFKYNQDNYGGFSSLIRSTFGDAKDGFEEKSIDLLHIDGLHTYEAVANDFESWLPKLSPSSLVLLHDINVHEKDFGVFRFWEELKKKYPYFEFQHGNGLGLVGTGSEFPEIIKALFKIDKKGDLTNSIRQIYMQLGRSLYEKRHLVYKEQQFIQITDDKDRKINNLKKRILQKETALQTINNRLTDKELLLREIHDSKAYRLVLGIRKFLAVTLGKNTFLRKGIDKFILFVFLMFTKGEGGFWQRMKMRSGKEDRRAINKWIKENEPDKAQLKQQARTVETFEFQPKISIIMPVYNTPVDILQAAIDSVLAQTYPSWELCIANGSPDSEPIRMLLDGYKEKDKRIRCTHLEKNLGIANNNNQAVGLAGGDFVAFLDHDDLLAPFALFEVVSALNEYPETELFYSDEDKITADGSQRLQRFFKPAFSLQYLHSVNYLCHFLVVRKTAGDTVGWFRDGFEGAQDFDFILRLIENVKVVTHIPKILYHWRIWEQSTASGADSKTYADTSGKKALKEHFERTGFSVSIADGILPTNYKVQYRLEKEPFISIIIPNKDHAPVLKKCIDSILKKTSYPRFEIIIVENNSTSDEIEQYYKQVSRDARVRVIDWDEPFHYSRINNWAASKAKGSVLLFLNNDMEVITPDWLAGLVQFTARPEVAAIGAKLYYPDDTIQHGGIVVGVGGIAGHSHKHLPRSESGYFARLVSTQNFSAITAACLMVRKEIFDEVGGFEESFPVAFGDVDLCLKFSHAGYLNVWTPYVELYHFESRTRGYEDTQEKMERAASEKYFFRKKWSTFLLNGDPFYNPNLSLIYQNFSIAEIPYNTKCRCVHLNSKKNKVN